MTDRFQKLRSALVREIRDKLASLRTPISRAPLHPFDVVYLQGIEIFASRPEDSGDGQHIAAVYQRRNSLGVFSAHKPEFVGQRRYEGTVLFKIVKDCKFPGVRHVPGRIIRHAKRGIASEQFLLAQNDTLFTVLFRRRDYLALASQIPLDDFVPFTEKFLFEIFERRLKIVFGKNIPHRQIPIGIFLGKKSRHDGRRVRSVKIKNLLKAPYRNARRMRLLRKRKRRKLGYRQIPHAKLLFIGRNRFGSIFGSGQGRGLFGRNLVKTRNREKAPGIVYPSPEDGAGSPQIQLVVTVF